MRDITGRHFENVSARHFIAAIDACYAGLSLPRHYYLDNPAEELSRLKEFRSLSIIKSETESHARNVLLSGTTDQRAISENGGIFTKALISGLQGKADFNHDGIIQFEELALYIKNEVHVMAIQVGESQDPESWRLDNLSPGNVIFILEPISQMPQEYNCRSQMD